MTILLWFMLTAGAARQQCVPTAELIVCGDNLTYVQKLGDDRLIIQIRRPADSKIIRFTNQATRDRAFRETIKTLHKPQVSSSESSQ